jgi:hypothetical protein
MATHSNSKPVGKEGTFIIPASIAQRRCRTVGEETPDTLQVSKTPAISRQIGDSDQPIKMEGEADDSEIGKRITDIR